MLWDFSKHIYVCICLGKIGVFCVLKDFGFHHYLSYLEFMHNSWDKQLFFPIYDPGCPYFTEIRMRLIGIVLVLKNRRANLFDISVFKNWPHNEQGLWILSGNHNFHGFICVRAYTNTS